MNKVHNNEKTGVWIGLLITLVGVALVILPALLGGDMMNIGFGLGCLGVVVFIAGLITAWLFGVRARTMDRILAGEEILASWTYDDTQGQQQVEKEYERSRGRNLAIYLTMVFWFVLIGGVFVAIDYFGNGEVSWLFVGSFFGFLCLLGAIAFVAPSLWRRQAAKASQEVIIAHNALVLNGALHTWAPPLNRLENVEFRNTSGEKTLEFRIRYLTTASITLHSTYTVSIPVPSGKERDAQETADYFRGSK